MEPIPALFNCKPLRQVWGRLRFCRDRARCNEKRPPAPSQMVADVCVCDVKHFHWVGAMPDYNGYQSQHWSRGCDGYHNYTILDECVIRGVQSTISELCRQFLLLKRG